MVVSKPFKTHSFRVNSYPDLPRLSNAFKGKGKFSLISVIFLTFVWPTNQRRVQYGALEDFLRNVCCDNILETFKFHMKCNISQKPIHHWYEKESYLSWKLFNDIIKMISVFIPFDMIHYKCCMV